MREKVADSNEMRALVSKLCDVLSSEAKMSHFLRHIETMDARQRVAIGRLGIVLLYEISACRRRQGDGPLTVRHWEGGGGAFCEMIYRLSQDESFPGNPASREGLGTGDGVMFL